MFIYKNSSLAIGLSWIPPNTFDDKSILVQLMVWCSQALARYMSPHALTRKKSVKTTFKWTPSNYILSITFGLLKTRERIYNTVAVKMYSNELTWWNGLVWTKAVQNMFISHYLMCFDRPSQCHSQGSHWVVFCCDLGGRGQFYPYPSRLIYLY